MNVKLCIIILFLFASLCYSQNKNTSLFILGKVYDRETKSLLNHVSIRINNSTIATETNKKGEFEFYLPKVKHLSIIFSFIGYKKEVKELSISIEEDTVKLSISLKKENIELPSVDINDKLKPDTVLGFRNFSILDFDFYEDKYLLLTEDVKTNKLNLKLADETQSILHSISIPFEAGKVKELYHDFMGYTNVMAEYKIYRILIRNDKLILASLPVEDYNALVKPVIDTINAQLLFSNFNKEYPLFNYLSYNYLDSTKKEIHTIEDKDLMHAYRFEYYSLKPQDQLLSRNLAQEYKVDKHVVAALISGFTKSMYYTPLYAPLYIVSDTICIFDHYKDCLFHYNKNGKKLDSININYHHPKNWKEWKNKMLKDFTEDKIYAVYDNSGHKYLKEINSKTGKDEGRYTIIHYSADKIRIRNGYIYYVYRPFQSLQEKFLYKEKIVLGKL